MRALSIREMELVSGGDEVSDADMAFAGAFSGAVGMSGAQWAGLSAARQLTVATYFGFAGTAVTGAFLLGMAAGQFLNDNTAVQSWIAGVVDNYVDPGPDGDGTY